MVLELQLVPGDLPAKPLITQGIRGEGTEIRHLLLQPRAGGLLYPRVNQGKKFTGFTALPRQRILPLGLLVMHSVYYYAHQIIGCANSWQFGRGLWAKSIQLIRLYNPKRGTLYFGITSFVALAS